MKTEKIIKHPQVQVDKYIKSLLEDFQFDLFLKTLRLAISKKSNAHPLLEILSQSDFSDSWVHQYYSFLLEYNISQGGKDQTKVKKEPIPSDLNKNINKMLELFSEACTEAEQEKQKFDSVYSSFRPAYKFDDLLCEYFTEQNPGEIIGNYCKHIFTCNKQIQSFMADDIPSIKITIESNSSHYKLCKNISEQLVNTITDQDISVALTEINKFFFEGKFSDSIVSSFKKIIMTPSAISQSIFDFVLEAILITEEIDDELIEELLLFPIEKSQNEDDSNIFFRLKYLEAFFDILHNQYFYLNHEREEIIINFLDGIKHIRQNIFFGQSPISQNACASIAYYLDYVKFKKITKIDSSILLSSCMGYLVSREDDGILFDDYLCDPTSSRNHNLLMARWRNYSVLINKIRHEGMYEFANSLTAFFVFTQSYYFHGAIANTDTVIPLIKEELITDYKKMVSTAIKLALEIINIFPNEPGNSLLYEILSQFIQKNNIITLYSGGKYQDESSYIKHSLYYDEETILKDIENDLIGKKAFAYLDVEQKNLLVEGEKYWRTLRFKDDNIGIVDWSGVVPFYCNFIELQLVQKFKHIITNQEYKSFLNSKRIKFHNSGGQILWLLESMPKKYLYLINNSGLADLISDKILFPKIKEIMSEYRNPAAHATKQINTKQYLKFRNLLFGEERTLGKFVLILNKDQQ